MASFEFVRWAGDAVFSGLIVDNNNITVMAASTCFSSPPSSSSKCNEDSFINSEENITDDNKIDESSFESFSLGSDILSCQSVEDSDISETASEDDDDDDDDSDYVDSNSEEDDDDCSWVDESLLDVSDNEIASLMRDTNEVIKVERDAKEYQKNDIIGQHEHKHTSSTSCSERSNEKLQEAIADGERHGRGDVDEQVDSCMDNRYNNNVNVIGNDDQQMPDIEAASDS